MVSLGCAKNLVDSEVLARQLEENRFELLFDPADDAGIDTAVINTCGFINDAKQESVDTILRFVDAKNRGQIGQVYVMGCLSERYKEKLAAEIPEVDAYFGVNDLREIIRHVGGTFRNNLLGERRLATPGHHAYLKIAEGCDRHCSFCAIPGIRGRHLSRPFEEILSEAQSLARQGITELSVISQDTTYYGLDLYKKRRLAELLAALSEIPGLIWIRLHYTYPDGFPPDVLDVMNSRPNICKYIDIPLQHVSDRILKSMRRGLDGTSTRDLIREIRARVPGVAIRTTLITGYPGETAVQFRELKEFISEFRFSRLGVFPYSHEEDTAAFSLKDSVSEKLKHSRVGELMELQEEISLSLNAEKVGHTMKVVIDREEADFYVARSEYDAPEVDNEVLVTKSRQVSPGTYCEVLITGAEPFDLYAEFM